MAKEAVTKALTDAKISYNDVNQAVVGYVYGKIIYKLLKNLINFENFR